MSPSTGQTVSLTNGRDTQPSVVVAGSIMIITKRYINSLKTPRGGWTKATLEKLGVSWPPQTGWQQRIIGTMLKPLPAEDQKKYLFERAL